MQFYFFYRTLHFTICTERIHVEAYNILRYHNLTGAYIDPYE
jgi:hypothetical protein